jgi:Transport protein particle (TRAPP) component
MKNKQQQQNKLYFLIHSTFVSVPADFGGLSVDSYISGIVAGLLEGAGFPARVTAHSVALEEGEQVPGGGSGSMGPTSSSSSGSGLHQPGSGGSSTASASTAMYLASYSISDLTGAPILPVRKEKTVFLVKFAQSVLARDSMMG